MGKKVAILGGGNGAFAMASDLALQGFEVRMWSKYFDEFQEIKKTHTIKVSGPLIQGEAKISRFCHRRDRNPSILDKEDESTGISDCGASMQFAHRYLPGKKDKRSH